MYYIYKIKKACEAGTKIVSLLQQIQESDEAADKLALSVRANAYLPHEYCDFGGIMAVSFPATALPSSEVWESVGEMEDGITYYIPKLKVREKWIKDEVRGQYENNMHYHIDPQPVEYGKVMCAFSREESAELIGYTLTTPSLERLCKKYNIGRRQQSMLRLGVPAADVVSKEHTEAVAEIARTQAEDYQLTEALSGVKIRRIEVLDGHERACLFYKACLKLPTIPRGVTNTLCGVDNSQYRCGIMEHEEYIYFTAPSETSLSEAVAITEEEFQQVCAIKDEESRKRNHK